MKLFLRFGIALLLCLGLFLSLASCTLKVSAEHLSKKYKAKNNLKGTLSEEGVLAGYRFALALLSATDTEKENQLISPLSVMLALGMTANGAQGDTRKEMEEAFGMSVEEMNLFLLGFLESSDRELFKAAQSIWLRDEGLSVEDAFLQATADYYGADAYAAKFDQSTVKDINRWVEYHTDGMIDQLLEQISPSAMLYLISAMAFDAKWETPYKQNQIQKDSFTHTDGKTETVDMMTSKESVYLALGDALGVLKYYQGGRYAFAGILPPEGVAPSDYLASLSGEDLAALLGSVRHGTVNAKIPAFSFSGDYLLNDALESLGMDLAFSSAADFSGIDKNAPLSIGEVRHKTFIDLSAEGTRAAAVTSVSVKATSLSPNEPLYIHLNRPFVAVILDTQTGLPLFIGVVNHIQ